MTDKPDDILNDFFHHCALQAWVEIYQETGQWPPDSEKTRRRAYHLYDTEKRKESTMSTTTHRLHEAYFPSGYADILMDVLGIGPHNFVNVKDALYHFRTLGDDQAAEVLEHIADRLETEDRPD